MSNPILELVDGIEGGMKHCGMAVVGEEAANSPVSKCLNFDSDNPPILVEEIEQLAPSNNEVANNSNLVLEQTPIPQ